ncbi:hypothetical protein PHMEG_00027031 [Phytophthora megakarya]|uniref:Reverse transcriptase domain-containing protein n=1 Tax=Phytophthora megakarya TaxID=4795 RepID=A0A225V7U9_9STRA|nr:hypothetical protein PHMEG_00027031 [Phytophthora megakarya]
MEHCFESLLYHSLVIWIDDLLFFADGIDTNFAELERFFDLVASFGLKLSAKTSSRMVLRMTQHVLTHCLKYLVQLLLANYKNSNALQIECANLLLTMIVLYNRYNSD